MKKEMIEALRLTREGKLTEAKTLIERALGLGSSPRPGQVVEPPPLPPASEGEGEPVFVESPKAPPTEAEGKAGDQTAVPPPLRPFTQQPGAKGMGRWRTGFATKPGVGGLAQRPIPLEQIAPAAGRWVAGSYTDQAGTRAYKLYLPSRYQGQSQALPLSLPLIVMLHGCTQNPDDFAAGTRMNFLAEEEGFLVVYPEQAAGANVSRCWNWFQPGDQQRDQGEPALIAGITRAVMAEHQAGNGRVYIAGLSAGGAMAAIMAAAYPDLYAAVGVHSGLAPGSAHDLPSALQAMQRGGPPKGTPTAAPGRAIPLILFQGDQDSTVHPGNAEALVRQWIPASSEGQVTTRQGQVPGGRAYTCAVYAGQSGQTLVERWTVHGGNHAWSGGSANGSFTDPTGPNASQELWRFFQKQG